MSFDALVLGVQINILLALWALIYTIYRLIAKLHFIHMQNVLIGRAHD